MAIKVPSEIIPNATDQKVTDAKYVKHTHHEGESDEEIMTQSSINESVLDGDIFKTINGNSIVGEGNIYTSTDSYVVCNSAASDNPKVITINNYQQVNGGNIRIKFTNANTAAPASGEDAVKLKIMTGTSTYVDGYLYYNNSPVNATNGWSAGETVTVYYDDTTGAEKYMANNAAGAELIDASQVDTKHPDTKKGLTEEAIVSVIGDVKKESGVYKTLQSQINEINDKSTTVSFTGTGNQFVGNRSFTLTASSTPSTTNGTISYYDGTQTQNVTWTDLLSKSITVAINSATPVAYRYTATFEVASTGTSKGTLILDRYLLDQVKYGFIENGLSSADIATALATDTTSTGVVNAMFSYGTVTNTARGRNYTLTIPKTGPTYHVIDSPDPSANPKDLGWFVLNATSNEYEPTEDVEVQSGTTYYYTVDKWVYFKVPKMPTTIILPDGTTVATSYVSNYINDIARVTEIGNQSIGRTLLDAYSDTYYNVYKANISVAKESRGSYTFYVS